MEQKIVPRAVLCKVNVNDWNVIDWKRRQTITRPHLYSPIFPCSFWWAKNFAALWSKICQKTRFIKFWILFFITSKHFSNANQAKLFSKCLFSFKRYSRVTLVNYFRIILSAKLFMENCIYPSIFLRPMFQETYFSHVALKCQK